MYGSTPSGRNKSVAYYLTHAKIDGKSFRARTEVIVRQIPEWLSGITISKSLVPVIRELYQQQIKTAALSDKEENLTQLKRKLKIFKQEEANLGRLVITEKISEEVYDRLRGGSGRRRPLISARRLRVWN